MSDGLSNDRGHCLVVSCHPLANSLCKHLAARVLRGLADSGLEIEHLDLYESGFTAHLTAAEREGYHAGTFDASALSREIATLRRAEILILVFPTWWFGMPALLKGWFDRVWAPGVAFNQPDKVGGRITPKLDGLRQCLVITTLGSPWWVDRLVVRRPLRRILKRVLIGACAPAARFEMLSVYSARGLDQQRLDRFLGKIDTAVKNIIRRASG